MSFLPAVFQSSFPLTPSQVIRRVLPAAVVGVGLAGGAGTAFAADAAENAVDAPVAVAASAQPVGVEAVQNTVTQWQQEVDRGVDTLLRSITGKGTVDTAEQINATAAQYGIAPVIPAPVIAAAAHATGVAYTEEGAGAAGTATNTADTPSAVVPTPEEAAAAFDPTRPGPNYSWRSDVLSQVMAGRPGPVLNRVSGSWFHGPDIPNESLAAQRRGKSLFGPGTPVFIGSNRLCTLGVAGVDKNGNAVGITAGHCGAPGDEVISADSWRVGPAGSVVATNPGDDYSVIQFNDRAELTRSYNGVTVSSLGGDTRPGDILCKSGVSTGHTCGRTLVETEHTNIAQVCAMRGDSGGPLLVGDRLVGVVSGGLFSDYRLSCTTPLQGPFFMPTTSVKFDAIAAKLNELGAVGAGFSLPTPPAPRP